MHVVAVLRDFSECKGNSVRSPSWATSGRTTCDPAPCAPQSPTHFGELVFVPSGLFSTSQCKAQTSLTLPVASVFLIEGPPFFGVILLRRPPMTPRNGRRFTSLRILTGGN